MKLAIKCLSSSLLLFALTAHADLADIGRIYRTTPSLTHLDICQGGGCLKPTSTSIEPEEWQLVAMLFATPSENAQQERARIALAIGQLETIVGEKIGTSHDKAGTFSHDTGQQDCNDEAINTTSYMRLLQQSGWMLFHQIKDIRTRNFFITGWPHSTASVQEIATGQIYAVDSWFYDNGHPAVVVPFDVWKHNYRPTDSPLNH